MWQRIKACISIWYVLLRVQWSMVYGVWQVSSLSKPIVTIFGGANLPQNDPYAQQAHSLARLLVENDISVLTGGGPGIMEAVSCGAILKGEHKAQNMGILVTDLNEPKNPCLQRSISMEHFF